MELSMRHGVQTIPFRLAKIPNLLNEFLKPL